MQTPSLNRIAAYYRTSTDEQERDETIKSQQQYVQRWSGRLGVNLVAEFFDDGISGMTELGDRDGFTALLQAAQRGEFDGVAVFAIDRLGRESYYVLHAFHVLRKLGIPILSATQSYDPHQATGRLLISLLAGAAESERINIHNRTESGKERLLSTDNLYLGGVVPYGYCLKWYGEKRLYAICDEPIPCQSDWTPKLLIEHVFARCAAGWSSERIATELQGLGLPTCWVPGDRRFGNPSRSAWRAQRVLNTLANPFYRGEQVVERREGSIVHRVPAIVSAEVWERCQQQRLKNRTMADRNAKQAYLLRGKIRCGLCGYSYCGAPAINGRKPVLRHYRCNWRGRLPRVPCPGRWVEADPLEQHVTERIQWILKHVDEFVAQVAGDQERAGSFAAERFAEADRLDRQRSAVENRMLEYYRQRADGLIRSDAILRQLLAEAESEAGALLKMAGEARQEAAQAMQQEAAMEGASDLLRRVTASLADEPTPAEWRQLIDLLVAGVTISTSGEGRHKTARARIQWRVGATVKPTNLYDVFYCARCQQPIAGLDCCHG